MTWPESVYLAAALPLIEQGTKLWYNSCFMHCGQCICKGQTFSRTMLITCFYLLNDKVNRCLARYSPRATTTNRPTNRAPNKPAWPGPNWPKNANFGPNLVVFGQKILFFTWEIKTFVTHITENPPRHLVHIVFWSGNGQNVQKNGNIWPKMTKRAYFGPNLNRFLGQKSPNFLWE